MLKALNTRTRTGITICWRNADPGGAQFDNDMQAFQKWGEARAGGSERRAVAKPRTDPDYRRVALTAGIIVLAWLALRHMLLKPLDRRLPAGERGGGRFNP
jgi:hypothetical protein